MVTATRRTIRAPRGISLTYNGWLQKAVLQLPVNTLDLGVVERPDDLIAYGGSSKTASNRPVGRGGTGAVQTPESTTNGAAALVIGIDLGIGPSVVVGPPAGDGEAAATPEREGLRLPGHEGRIC